MKTSEFQNTIERLPRRRMTTLHDRLTEDLKKGSDEKAARDLLDEITAETQVWKSKWTHWSKKKKLKIQLDFKHIECYFREPFTCKVFVSTSYCWQINIGSF